MTLKEAREKLLEIVKKYYTDDECPLAWVGEVEGEIDGEFIFSAGIHNDKEAPQVNIGQFMVNKKTGECRPFLVEE